jgi:hypothetical protein
MLWTSGNLFHVAWQGNFEQWVKDPLNVRPIAHAIWDPQFGQPAPSNLAPRINRHRDGLASQCIDNMACIATQSSPSQWTFKFVSLN